MTDTVGLPRGWAEASLGDVFQWGSGGTPRKGTPAYYDGDIPWAIIGDLSDGPIAETAQAITERGLRESSAKWVEPNSVLVAMYGSIGKLGISTIRLTTNQAIAFTRPEPIPAKYLFYYLMRERHALIGQGKGGTQSNISQTVLKAYPFVVAPLAEQHRIVGAIESYLTRLDNAVALLERVKQNLKRYRASVLKAAVEGRLVPTEAELARREGRSYEPASELLKRILAERKTRWIEDAAEKARAKTEEKARKAGQPWTAEDDLATLEKERAKAAKQYKEPATPDTADLPGLPEGWCWTTIAQLATDVTYGSSARTGSDPGGGVPVLRMGNIVDGRVSFTDLKYLDRDHVKFPSLFLQLGDMLFNRTNSAELVGKSAVYSGEVTPCSFASYLIRVRFAVCAHAGFVTLFLNSSWGRAWVASVVSQQVGQANVNGTKLRACHVPLPPWAEQQRIMAETDRVLTLAETVALEVCRGNQRNAHLRQAILKWAFEGKLVEQDPDDEPASVLLERIRAERAAVAAEKPRARKRRSAE